jgi:hypothetical protein
MALPAPHPDATPVATSPPADNPLDAAVDGRDRATPGDATGSPARRPDGPETGAAFDEVVDWNEPPSPIQEFVAAGAGAAQRSRDAALLTSAPSDLWIDELDQNGVAAGEVDAGAATSRLAPLPVRPVDQFEVIWPSGETDDVVDADEPTPDVDHDRVGPTARVHHATNTSGDTPDPESSGASDDQTDPGDDDNQLAVRRAVATIDTGSLDARRRLADVSSDATAPPGRLVVQREASVWRSGNAAPTTSVFDEQPVDTGEPAADPTDDDNAHQGRSNALRRLIGSLKRS